MVKSTKKKIEAFKRGKVDNGKRDNPNRGKHGCSRLHELNRQRAMEEQRKNNTKIENIKIDFNDKSTGLFGKVKGWFKR